MSEWIKLSDKIPNRKILCDFLIVPGDPMEEIWILCQAFPFQYADYGTSTDVIAWRPAESLPEWAEDIMQKYEDDEPT